MTTVALIADAAFDAVALAITDAISDVTATYEMQGAYNATTGAYAVTETTAAGRCVLDTVKPIDDVFPAYIVGPKDQLFLIEGITALSEGNKLTIGGLNYRVSAAQDIVGAGSLFYAVAQEVQS